MAAFTKVQAERQVSISSYSQQPLARFQSGVTAPANRFTHPTDHRIQSVNKEMMKAIWQHGLMFGRKLEALEDKGVFLAREKIRLTAEIVQIKELWEIEWPIHIQRVQKDVEVIYTKFKALNEQVEKDRLAVEGPCQLALQKENRGKAEAEMDAILAVCNLYHYSLGFFFKKVERCHQNLASFPQDVQQEKPQAMIEQAADAQLVKRIPEQQEENAFGNVSNEMSLFFEGLEQDFNAQIEPLQKANFIAEEEKNRLESEKILLRETYLKTRALYHSCLKEHLTLPTQSDYAYKNLCACRRMEKPASSEQKTYEYFFHHQSKVPEHAEKILPKWDEIALLITQLLNSLDP